MLFVEEGITTKKAKEFPLLETRAKARLVPSNDVLNSGPQVKPLWVEACQKELQSFVREEALGTATAQQLKDYQASGQKPVPCTIVFSPKTISEHRIYPHLGNTRHERAFGEISIQALLQTPLQPTPMHT